MSKEFEGRTALVTGGGKGIGRAITLELASRGADVAINFRRDEQAAVETAKLAEAQGVRAVLVQGDISDEDTAIEIVRRSREELGPITLLVNNAAYTKRQAPAEITLRSWRAIFASNVEAAFHLIWLVKQDMLAQGQGAVVNISSRAAVSADPMMIAYGASKAALNALTASTAASFARDNIRINAVAPGFIRTPRVDTVDPETQAAMLRQIPVGRIGEPEDIAQTVGFLLSGAASFVTGQVWSVAGGQ